MADTGQFDHLSGEGPSEGDVVELVECIGIVGTQRKRTRQGKVIYRETTCTNLVDITQPSGRYCANCLVPSTRRAFEELDTYVGGTDEEHPMTYHKDHLLAILMWNDEDDLVYVREAHRSFRPIVDRVLALRGIDGFFLERTWMGAVRSLKRLKQAIYNDISARGHPTLRIDAMPTPGKVLWGPMPAAARQGRLEELRYAHDQGYPFYRQHLSIAAKHGHINILKSDAITWGSYDIIRGSIPIDRRVMYDTYATVAIQNNQLGVLQWLDSMFWVPSVAHAHFLVRTPNIEIAEWLFFTRKGVTGFQKEAWTPTLCMMAQLPNVYTGSKPMPPSIVMITWMHRGTDPDTWPCKGECKYAQDHPGLTARK